MPSAKCIRKYVLVDRIHTCDRKFRLMFAKSGFISVGVLFHLQGLRPCCKQSQNFLDGKL